MVVTLTALVSVILVSYITCMEVNLTTSSGEEVFLEIENGESVVREINLFTSTENPPVFKKYPGCDSKDCKNHTENLNRFTPKIIVHRHKYVRTPPKSYNFLATIPALASSRTGDRKKQPREKIRIYKLDEEVKKSEEEKLHGWPMEFEYGMENPDHKIEENEEDIEYVDIDDTKSTNPEPIGITVTLFEELKGKYSSETDQRPKMITKEYGKTIEPKVITNNKEDKGFTTPSKFITKKDRSKLNEKGKFYNDKKKWTNPPSEASEPIISYKSTSTPKQISSFSSLNVEKQVFFSTQKPTTTEFVNTSTKRQLKVNRFPIGLFPNSNSSFNILRYPVYFTANPIVYEKKLVIPYPYFVLKTDRKKHPRTEQEILKEIEDGVRVDISENPQKKKIKVNPDVEIVYDVDYMELENDEDYVPSTEEYDEDITQNVDLTTSVNTDIPTKVSSGIATEATSTNNPSTATATHRGHIRTTDDGKHTYHFKFKTTHASTKYPDPYRDGSIYFYYDCLLASRANSNSEHKTQHLIITTVFLYFFVNIITL